MASKILLLKIMFQKIAENSLNKMIFFETKSILKETHLISLANGYFSQILYFSDVFLST